jgi:hypothetical protein
MSIAQARSDSYGVCVIVTLSALTPVLGGAPRVLIPPQNIPCMLSTIGDPWSRDPQESDL